MQHSLVLQATTSDPNKSSLDGRDGEEEEEEEKVIKEPGEIDREIVFVCVCEKEREV